MDTLSDRFAWGLRTPGRPAEPSRSPAAAEPPEFLIAYFGILKAGSVVVPLNLLLKAPEIAYQLTNSEARGSGHVGRVRGEAAKGAADAGVDQIYVVNVPGAPESPSVSPFEELLAGEPA